MENYCMYVQNTEVSLPRPSKLSVAKEKGNNQLKMNSHQRFEARIVIGRPVVWWKRCLQFRGHNYKLMSMARVYWPYQN